MIVRQTLLAILVGFGSIESGRAFVNQHGRPESLVLHAEVNQDQAKTDNPISKGAWYAVESFGKLFGKKKESQVATIEATTPTVYSTETLPQSIQETMATTHFLSAINNVTRSSDLP